MGELRKKMTWEEFLVYPRKLGWNYEYYADFLHIQPACSAIAKFSLSLDELRPLRARVIGKTSASVSIRLVEHSDNSALVALFCDCFLESIDYAGYDPSRIARAANRTLDRFFEPSPTKYFRACRIAVAGERIIGCCTIDDGEPGPVLQPIFVAADWRRRGIASRLLLDALQSLAEMSEPRVHSRCNLGNEASMAWHLQCGFIEVPCFISAGHRANVYMQEAERHELLGLPSAAAMRELADYWADQHVRLEAENR